jgi:hypothetical protein
MFKTMKSCGLQMQADLALAGHPNKFQSKPVAIKLDWDVLQDMDHPHCCARIATLATHLHGSVALLLYMEMRCLTRAPCCSARDLNTALVPYIPESNHQRQGADDAHTEIVLIGVKGRR